MSYGNRELSHNPNECRILAKVILLARRCKEYMRKIFRLDNDFVESVREFKKIDMLLALLLCFSLVFFGFWLHGHGIHHEWLLGLISDLSESSRLLVSALFSATVIGLVFLICKIRKQKVFTVGLNKHQAKKSLIAGLVFGSIHVLLRVALGRTEFSFRDDLSVDTLIFNAIYHLVFVAFMEELLLRGYTASRLFGSLKNKVFAIILGGFITAMLHVPSDAAMPDVGAFQILANRFIGDTLLHGAFFWLYAKYNNLLGPILWHFMLNFVWFITV